MAIIALDQSFIYTVMKGPVKLLLGFKVTAITKLRLLVAQQMFCNFGMMRRMALNAANVVLHVGCSGKVIMLGILRMTG